MHPLLAALSDALRHHGLTVSEDAALEGRSGAVYQIPLLVEADGEAFLLDLYANGIMPAEVAERLADITDDVGASGAILCHLEAAATTDADVRLWGRDDLVRIIGESAFAAAGLDARPPVLVPERSGPPVAESLSDLLPPAFEDDAPKNGVDLLEAEPAVAFDGMSMFDTDDGIRLEGLEDLPMADLLDDELGLDSPVPAFDRLPGQQESPAAPPATQYAYPLLPVRITTQEAVHRVKDRLFRVNAIEMVLQPVHLLDYECDLLAEGSLRYDTVRGRIEVHGTDKHITEVEPEAVDPAGFTKEIPADIEATERTNRVTDERAKERGRTYLVEAHTRMVPVQIEDADGAFSYTEKKRVAPRPDHVRLHHLGTFHRILWRLRGPNGKADVDALTGQVVEETLASPDTDTIILD